MAVRTLETGWIPISSAWADGKLKEKPFHNVGLNRGQNAFPRKGKYWNPVQSDDHAIGCHS